MLKTVVERRDVRKHRGIEDTSRTDDEDVVECLAHCRRKVDESQGPERLEGSREAADPSPAGDGCRHVDHDREEHELGWAPSALLDSVQGPLLTKSRSFQIERRYALGVKRKPSAMTLTRNSPSEEPQCQASRLREANVPTKARPKA